MKTLTIHRLAAVILSSDQHDWWKKHIDMKFVGFATKELNTSLPNMGRVCRLSVICPATTIQNKDWEMYHEILDLMSKLQGKTSRELKQLCGVGA